MCGIAGSIGRTDGESAVARMVGSIRHRGPDDHGVVKVDETHELVLGSTRLAVLDLSPAGHMPMADPVTGNWIVFNGEIHNFLDLRRQLETEGVVFASHTDTEVLLKGYAQWGIEVVERTRGMFAFALWDRAREELILARDRFGEKPLYYARNPQNGAFAFASELRALLASGLVSRRLDASAVSRYLFNGFCTGPGTLVDGIESLPPATWMRVGTSGLILEIRRYWHSHKAAYPWSRSDGDHERLREVFRESVRIRMLSDAPLGAFLSGGLDSSAIVAAMAEMSSDVRTFAITFNEQEYDESPYSKWVAERFATKHSEVRLGLPEFGNWLDDALAAFDVPSFDGINTYFVSRAAREAGLTVALSGVGGDELFGGYPFFGTACKLAALSRLSSILPPQLLSKIPGRINRNVAQLMGARKTLELLCFPRHDALEHLLAGYQITQVLFPTWSRKELLASADSANGDWFGLSPEFKAFILEECRQGSSLDNLCMIMGRLFLGSRCLGDTDTMSMAVSLEVRAPFTDHVLVENMLGVPSAIRCAGSPDKPFEWKLFKPILGGDYPYRQKKGFVFPFNQWLREQPFRSRILDTVQDPDRARRCGLNPVGARELVHAFLAPGSKVPWSRIWCLYVLMDWCRRNGVETE